MMGQTDTMTRHRNIRLSNAQDDELERIARAEGLSVSALIRQNLIRSFSLPTDGTNGHSTGFNSPAANNDMPPLLASSEGGAEEAGDAA